MKREESITHGKEQLEVFGGEHREFIEMAIKALEQEPSSSENPNRWIPCSERLPEDDEDVLVQMTDYSMMVDFRTASSSGWFWAEKDDLPIAWMPLPEPYKAESEENK